MIKARADAANQELFGQPHWGRRDRRATLEAVVVQRRKRILIIDDHVEAADSLALLLHGMGYHALVAYDASSALEIFRAALPDVVLLETSLQEMNGYYLARRMRELLGARVKICALTADALTKDRIRSAQAGLDHHLVKPVDLVFLRGVLG